MKVFSVIWNLPANKLQTSIIMPNFVFFIYMFGQAMLSKLKLNQLYFKDTSFVNRNEYSMSFWLPIPTMPSCWRMTGALTRRYSMSI